MSSKTIPRGCFGSVVAFSKSSLTCRSCDLNQACRREVRAREPRVLKIYLREIDRLATEDEAKSKKLVGTAKAVGEIFSSRRK